MTQIAVIVGSLRRDSYNRRLAQALEKLAPHDFQFQYLDISQLPLYNQDDDKQQAEVVLQFKQAISDSQALLFVTPEYNRSVPGVLKNALDHASRPYGKNVWAGKPAGVLGASIGAIGTALAQQHLRNILADLDAPTLGQPEVVLKVDDKFFAEDGSVANEGSRKFLQGWMDAYAAWVKKHAA